MLTTAMSNNTQLLQPPLHLDSQPALAGQITRHSSTSGFALDYHLYVPTAGGEGAPMMVAVHGISRRAKRQVRLFAELAERYGVVLLAPRFNSKRFPGYQRLGMTRGRVCSQPDRALLAVVQEVGELTGARTDRLSLFGYSGGGQFVHRFAMAYPERVRSVSMGAPGWYTFPDAEATFPRGIRRSKQCPQPSMSFSQILQVPMAVFVGERDRQRDPALNTAARIDAQQGRDRLERGQRWVRAMQLAAERFGYRTRYEFRRLENCGHSFTECMIRGDMGRQVFEFLFADHRNQPRTLPRQLHSNRVSPFVMFQSL